MREKILARHQEELKILEMDANMLRNLETGLMVFHQRFMSVQQLPTVDAATSSTADGPANDKPDDTAEVITLAAAKPDEPEPARDDRGPNFLQRARKWAGGGAELNADG